MRRSVAIVVIAGALILAVVLLVRRGKHATREPTAPQEQSAIFTAPAETAPAPEDLGAAPQSPHLNPAPSGRVIDKTDDAIIAELRENVRSNPQRAEQLARESRQRFPESTNGDERDALLVDALINQQRIGAARSETYYYYDHHPEGRFTEHLFVMTGVHPTPVGPGMQ